MSPLLYLFLFIIPLLSGISIILYILYKKNSHTELYSEGLRNGCYTTALHNYEDALSEIRKLKLNNKFGVKIAQRIKILRTTIDYERNFQRSNGNGG
jgi:hypothetical protein